MGVRYVLEGALDRTADDLRLTLQLVDARSGRALWSENFNGQLRDLPGLDRRVTGTVAQSLQLRLLEAESRQAQLRPASDVRAQDLALQAWALLRRRGAADIEAARQLLQQAVERDAQSAFAWALLADSYAMDVGGRTSNPDAKGATRSNWLRLGEQAATRAYALEPNNTHVLAARAWVLSLQGRAEEALPLIQRHLEINRNDAAAWYHLAYVSVTLGRQEDAIKAAQEAVRLSPLDASLNGFYVVLAAAHLYLGHDLDALGWARKSAATRPDFSVAYSWIASAAANAGETKTARTAIAQFRRLRPDYTVASFRREGLCANALCEAQRERYYAGLRNAGLTE